MSFLFASASANEAALPKSYCSFSDLDDSDYQGRILRDRTPQYISAQLAEKLPKQFLDTNNLKRAYSAYVGETLFENDAAALKGLYDQLCEKINALEIQAAFPAIDNDFYPADMNQKTMEYIENCFSKAENLKSSLHDFNYKDAAFPTDALTEISNLILPLKNSELRGNKRVSYILSTVDMIKEVEKAYLSLKAMETQIKTGGLMSGFYSMLWNRNFSVYSSRDLAALSRRIVSVSAAAPAAPQTVRPAIFDPSALHTEHFSLSSSTANSSQARDISSHNSESVSVPIAAVPAAMPAAPSTPRPPIFDPSTLIMDHFSQPSASSPNPNPSGAVAASSIQPVAVPVIVASHSSAHIDSVHVAAISTSNSVSDIPPPPPAPTMEEVHSVVNARRVSTALSSAPASKTDLKKRITSQLPQMPVVIPSGNPQARLRKTSKVEKKEAKDRDRSSDKSVTRRDSLPSSAIKSSSRPKEEVKAGAASRPIFRPPVARERVAAPVLASAEKPHEPQQPFTFSKTVERFKLEKKKHPERKAADDATSKITSRRGAIKGESDSEDEGDWSDKD